MSSSPTSNSSSLRYFAFCCAFQSFLVRVLFIIANRQLSVHLSKDTLIWCSFWFNFGPAFALVQNISIQESPVSICFIDNEKRNNDKPRDQPGIVGERDGWRHRWRWYYQMLNPSSDRCRLFGYSASNLITQVILSSLVSFFVYL